MFLSNIIQVYVHFGRRLTEHPGREPSSPRMLETWRCYSSVDSSPVSEQPPRPPQPNPTSLKSPRTDRGAGTWVFRTRSTTSVRSWLLVSPHVSFQIHTIDLNSFRRSLLVSSRTTTPGESHSASNVYPGEPTCSSSYSAGNLPDGSTPEVERRKLGGYWLSSTPEMET